MSLSDQSTYPTPTTRQDSMPGFEDTEPVDSMQEFYKLYQEFLLITLVLTGIVFISVWIFYSLNIALNYLLGAFTGMLYMRMLAKDVERLGPQKRQLNKNRFALLVVIILLASRWNELQIMPIFLGFLTYKATLIFYVVREAFISGLPNIPKP
ncbi:ATP synthase subunit I [Fischerella thermalis BR2B]|uniref:ATP synthase subunit I n=1 Tax=Fischerella thermalis TaxID=372787 RepID=UPI000587031D|nr:ATP synthase subunit I [Fischerella thermalis]PMB35406.1 ATP synthase subunit I [Fischerella thermalis BR2B]